MEDNRKIISVFGSSKAEPGSKLYELAYNVGKGLSENGYTVANGGYGGTMLASAKGASDAGGRVIGVSCTAFKRSGINEYIDDEIRTETLRQRLDSLVDIACGYIVLPGGTGTLLELAHIWEHKNKHFLKEDKPVIMLSDFWRPLVEMMTGIDPKCADCVKLASDAPRAVELLS